MKTIKGWDHFLKENEKAPENGSIEYYWGIPDGDEDDGNLYFFYIPLTELLRYQVRQEP